MLWWMLSWSGNGVTSLMVLSFCFQLSTTIQRSSSFFGRHSIGAADAMLLLVHHPVVVYFSIFLRSCIFNESRHLGGWYIGLYVRSIKLILCTTFRIGGTLSGTRTVKSLMFLIHFFWSAAQCAGVIDMVILTEQVDGFWAGLVRPALAWSHLGLTVFLFTMVIVVAVPMVVSCLVDFSPMLVSFASVILPFFDGELNFQCGVHCVWL